MTISHPRSVLLAVDDGPAAQASLDFAIHEAGRTNADLHLLHVVHPYPTNSQELAVGHEFIGPAQQMLNVMAKEAADRLRGARVTTEVAQGLVVSTIVARCRDALEVVLQGEDHGRLARIITGQIRNGVASRATVPVVCVPPGWTAPHGQPELVVVGIDDPGHAVGQIRAALDATSDRGCRVRFLTTWWGEPQDDSGATTQRIDEWIDDTEQVLRRAVDEVARDYAQIDTEVVARRQRPADALVDESCLASLLVIGRRDPRLPHGSHIGPIARAVLQRSECPVMVVESALVTPTTASEPESRVSRRGAEENPDG